MGVSNLMAGLPYMGGACKIWFIPREEVISMPPINPANQYLLNEITLVQDKVWRGPVPVPDGQLGIIETQENSRAGSSFKFKVSASYPGDVPQSRVNLDNMIYHEYLLVAKMRSGGFYMLIGDTQRGMDFEQDYDSGTGNGKNAGHKIAFTHEQIYKALVLPSFNGDESGFITPPPGGTGSVCTNDGEIIYITNESSKQITWTLDRQTRFGDFPSVETWLQDENGIYYKAAVQPYIDAPPPTMTTMDWAFGGNVTGFITIK